MMRKMLKTSLKLKEIQIRKLPLKKKLNVIQINRFKLHNLLGAVAQLGERLDGIQKVVGSIPSSSTKKRFKFNIFQELLN